MEELRRCKTKYEQEKAKQYYFHKWSEKGQTVFHAEDPQKDTTYVETFAIIEDVETGEVNHCEPKSIIFI